MERQKKAVIVVKLVFFMNILLNMACFEWEAPLLLGPGRISVKLVYTVSTPVPYLGNKD